MDSERRLPPTAVPVVLCFDLEPDEAVRLPPPADGAEWQGVPATIGLVEDWRGRLEEATGEGAAFSWYLRMDPAIEWLHGDACWAADRFGPLFENLMSKGDAFGLHTHALRWDAQRETWLADHGDRAWMSHVVEASAAAYAGWRGRPSRLNRIGDRFMTDEIMSDLERLGTQIDLTVEPGRRGQPTLDPELPYSGSLPDYSVGVRTPYRPSHQDFRRAARGEADARAIWEMPLASVDYRPLTSLPRRGARFVRYPGRPPYRQLPLSDYTISGNLFWDLVERDLSRNEPICIVLATRSDMVLKPAGRATFDDKLNALARRPLAQSLRFVTPHEALRILGLEAGAEPQPD